MPERIAPALPVVHDTLKRTQTNSAAADGFAAGLIHDSPTEVGQATHLTGTTTLDWQWLTTTVDSENSVGKFNALAIGADGLPIVSYWDNSQNDLKVAKCLVLSCSSAVRTIVDSDGGSDTDITIGTDGLPVISHYDVASRDLKVAKCEDDGCTSAILTTLDSEGDVGWFTSLAIGADGLPIISYYDASNQDLKVAKCQTISCTSAITTTLDSAGNVGWFTSLAIGTDDLPIIGYLDDGNDALKVAKCVDVDCSSATLTTVDTLDVGANPSVAMGADGLPIISYFDFGNALVKVATCLDASCASATLTVVDHAGIVNYASPTSIAIGTDGLPVISYFSLNTFDVTVARCQTPDCASVISTTVDSAGGGESLVPLAIGADGLPVVSYRDEANQTLKVAKAVVSADYVIDYGDAITASGTISGLGLHTLPFTHTYAVAGTYTAMLTLTSGLSTSTASAEVVIAEPPPKVLTATLANDSPSVLGQATHLSGGYFLTGSMKALSDWQWQNRIVDDTGAVGDYNALAIGADGLPVLSYFDASNGDLKVALCTDADCTSAISTTIDSGGYVGVYNAIAIGADNLPIISYLDFSNSDLKVAKCLNVSCTNVTLTTVDSTGGVGWFTALAIGTDGLPVISYYDNGNRDLKVAKCQDISCASAAVTILDSAGWVGQYTSLAIGADGLPVISYFDDTNDDLKLAKCQTISCTSAVITIVDDGGGINDVGSHPSLAIGTDGLPVIAYQDNTHQALKVAVCRDLNCASAISTTLDTVGNIDLYPSLVIGADGRPLISYRDATMNTLKLAQCQTVICTSAALTTLDSTHLINFYTSLVMGADGLPMISYHDTPNDGSNGFLRIAKAYVPVDYALDYGDGSVESGSTRGVGLHTLPFTHTYVAAGSYTALLTVTNGMSTSMASTPVTITAPLPPVIKVVTLTHDSPTELGLATHLTATRSSGWITGAVNYILDYGDGTSAVTGNWSADPFVFAYSYAAAGRYTAVLTATDGLSTSTANTVVTIVDSFVPPSKNLTSSLSSDSPISLGSAIHFEGRYNLTGMMLSDWSWARTTVDSINDVGQYSSLEIGADGLPVISYFGNDGLKVAKCQTISCTSATSTKIDTEVAFYTSLAIGADGLPIISYLGHQNNDLKVAKCQNVSCTSAIITTLDSVGIVGYYSSLAIGTDGLPIISYYDVDHDALKVAQCQTVSCTTAQITTVDNAGNVGGFTSIAIGRDGLPVISYYDTDKGDLKVAKCQTAGCTSATLTTVDSAGDIGLYTSLAIGSDGFPVISYQGNTSLKVAKCWTADCTSAFTTTVDRDNSPSRGTSLSIGIDGRPVMSYRDGSNHVKVLQCQTISCTRVLNTAGDGLANSAIDSSLAIGIDGLPIISYYDLINSDLKVVKASVPVSYAIDYGDGVTASGRVDGVGLRSLPFTHTYAAVGTYTARLTVTTGISTNTASHLVRVMALPPVLPKVVTLTNNSPTVLGQITHLTATRSTGLQRGAVTYTLNYGDGAAVITGIWNRDPMLFPHTYTAAGTHTATLTATDGVSISMSRSVVVITAPLPPPPAVKTITLTSDSPTLLGYVTQLTATRSAGLMSGTVNYALNYGDGSAVVTGLWGADPLVFTRAYGAAGHYTAILTVTDGIDTRVTNTPITISAQAGLAGHLSTLRVGRQITFTFGVTNASGALPATNVVVSGSVPANAVLVNAFGARSVSTGGDYGTGFVQSQTPVTLMPGESITLQWVVEATGFADEVTTRGHATSDAGSLDLMAEATLNRIFLPMIRKDAGL